MLQFALRSRRTAKRHYVRAGAQTVEVVSPRLHHLATFLEPLRPVVRRSHFVAFLVRKLQFDDIRRKPELVRSVDAMARNPCQLICSPVYPMRRRAAVMALSLSGLCEVRGDGKT